MMDIVDKNLLMNSGSYFIISVGLILYYFLKAIINRIAVHCSRKPMARKIGIWAYEKSYKKTMWQAALKLFIECYFDLTMCVMLSVLSFFELGDEGFMSLFTSPKMNKSDKMATVLTLVYSLLIIVVPIWGYIGIKSNLKSLERHRVMDKYGIFYADNRTDTHARAMYNIYFLERRFVAVVILVYGGAWPYG